MHMYMYFFSAQIESIALILVRSPALKPLYMYYHLHAFSYITRIDISSTACYFFYEKLLSSGNLFLKIECLNPKLFISNNDI